MLSILVQRKMLALWNPPPMKIFCIRHCVQWWVSSSLMSLALPICWDKLRNLNADCSALLGNDNMATNLHVVTSSYGNRRFVTRECWTQVIQGDSEFWLRIVTYFIASCAKRSMINLKYPLLVWDWTFLPIMRMSVHRQKVSKDKQGFIESGFDCFGRDLTRLQLLFLSDAGKSCYCR